MTVRDHHLLGNCRGVRLPKEMLDTYHLHAGDEPAIDRQSNGILLRPIREPPSNLSRTSLQGDGVRSPLISRIAICGNTTRCPDPGLPCCEPVDVANMALAQWRIPGPRGLLLGKWTAAQPVRLQVRQKPVVLNRAAFHTGVCLPRGRNGLLPVAVSPAQTRQHETAMSRLLAVRRPAHLLQLRGRYRMWSAADRSPLGFEQAGAQRRCEFVSRPHPWHDVPRATVSARLHADLGSSHYEGHGRSKGSEGRSRR